MGSIAQGCGREANIARAACATCCCQC